MPNPPLGLFASGPSLKERIFSLSASLLPTNDAGHAIGRLQTFAYSAKGPLPNL